MGDATLTEEILYEFSINSEKFQIYHNGKKVFLRTDDKKYDVEVAIPTPGHYDTTHPANTFDDRGVRTLKFENPEIKDGKARIMVSIEDFGQYWSYSLDDDDWRDKVPSLTKKRLEVIIDEKGEKSSNIEHLGKFRIPLGRH